MEHLRSYEMRMNRAELRHPAFAAENHPIAVNIGTIQGGEWNSSVATAGEAWRAGWGDARPFVP